jgi:hypothetical protein
MNLMSKMRDEEMKIRRLGEETEQARYERVGINNAGRIKNRQSRSGLAMMGA